MHLRTGRVAGWAVVIAVAAIVAAAASASGRDDPKRLVLARADLPAGAVLVEKDTGPAAALASILVDAPGRTLFRSSHHYQAGYRVGAKDVFSAAFVFRSVAQARSAFTRAADSLPGVYRQVTLPRLGDAQVTTFTIADAYEHRFVVRRGRVVWQLDVLDWSAGPRARFTAEAAALARKQRARVG